MTGSVVRCQSIVQVSCNQVVGTFALPRLPRKVDPVESAIFKYGAGDGIRTHDVQPGRLAADHSSGRKSTGSASLRYLVTSEIESASRVGSVRQNARHGQSGEDSQAQRYKSLSFYGLRL